MPGSGKTIGNKGQKEKGEPEKTTGKIQNVFGDLKNEAKK
jgi:uncharacterized protein YjbJ (UPF0337 family)